MRRWWELAVKLIWPRTGWCVQNSCKWRRQVADGQGLSARDRGNGRLLRPGVIPEGFLEEAGLALGLSVSCFSCLQCSQENAGLRPGC